MIGLDKTSRAMRATDSRASSSIGDILERNLKIFSLADIFNAGEAQQLNRMLNGFALGIEYARA